MTKQERAELRRLLGDYIASEGCSCCENIDEHKAAGDALGKLLKVSKYKDGSGYDFRRYRSLEDSHGS
jgi:hypothetical protein